MIVGYIETKPIGTDLDKIIDPKSDTRDAKQLRMYLNIINNLVLTNYNEFILYKDGIIVNRKHLFYLTDKTLKNDNIKQVLDLFTGFFSTAPKQIVLVEDLSKLLAKRAILLRDNLSESLETQKNHPFIETLFGANSLIDVIRETLIQDLTNEEFIDTYTQTLTYGLFLAKLNSNIVPLTKNNVVDYIPSTMGIIQELFETIRIRTIPDTIGWILDEILNVLNNTKIDEIKEGLSFSRIYKYEDPYVYFYEHFLKIYDPEERIARGVFYTPIPVVWFIINSIQNILKTDLRSDGIKDSRIHILDFATGTGTFLLEAFKIAIDETDVGARISLIKDHLLQNFYGFEYLIAPYTIAHLKLSNFLENNGYEVKEKERLKIYLTDTLDDQRHKKWSLLPRLSEEGEESYDVKMNNPILVVIGNPPYNIKSRNKKPFTEKLLAPFKEGLEEKKVSWDDYEKFIAYAKWKIDQNGSGVIGVITNNSFIDSIVKPIMRKCLIDDFDYIYILNLHGNKRRGEIDENIFDIMVGVAISIFVKLPNSIPESEKKIKYYSTLNNGIIKREDKFDFLLKNTIKNIEWEEILPQPSEYYLKPREKAFEEEYDECWSLTNIFNVYSSGISTDRDTLFIDFEKDNLESRIQKLLSGDYDEQFKKEFNVNNSSSYPLLERLEGASFDRDCVQSVHYRPFDYRWIYYDLGLTSRPAFEIMYHLQRENLGLISVRQFAEDVIFNHVFVTDRMTERRITSSNRGAGYIFPIYRYNQNDKNLVQTNFGENAISKYYEIDKNAEKMPNFTNEFIEFISKKYPIRINPEDIFYYIYAILHSFRYRSKYNSFLKEDYPKIPFVDSYDDFVSISSLGKELVSNHLLKNDYGKTNIGSYPIEGDNNVIFVKYDKQNNCIYINDKQYFENISFDMYNTYIGGYQILEKWLKERMGRKLSYEELEQYKKITNSINNTLEIIIKINQFKI